MKHEITYLKEQNLKTLGSESQEIYTMMWNEIETNTLRMMKDTVEQFNKTAKKSEMIFESLGLEPIGSCYSSTVEISFKVESPKGTVLIGLDTWTDRLTQAPQNRTVLLTEDEDGFDLRTLETDSRTLKEKISEALHFYGINKSEETADEILKGLEAIREDLEDSHGDLESALGINEEDEKAIEEAAQAMIDDLEANFEVSLNLNQFLNETIIVHSSTLGIFITWNQSATFNTYTQNGTAIDCFTRYEVRNLESATNEGLEYIFEQLKEFYKN